MDDLFSVSVVLFENDPGELEELISNVLSSSISVKLFLIDNSADNRLKAFCERDHVTYIFNNSNIGYGAAHNVAIALSQVENMKYHLVMNPDISFGRSVLRDIFNYMELHPEIGQLMPKILYPDGEIQRLCKLLPTPFDLIGRRFFKNSQWAKKRNQKYELDGFGYDKILNSPSLSGCFMFLRNDILKQTGGFDPRYFMYLEDYDLTRRIHAISKTIFYPEVCIYHGHKKESYINKTLLKYHITSAIRYFNKWGWIWDSERTRLNQQTTNQIYK